MQRRELFKMLGAAVAGAVCAPLAKLLPVKPIPSNSPRFSPGSEWNMPVKVGSTVVIRLPQRWITAANIRQMYNVPPELARAYAQGEIGSVQGVTWDEETNVASHI